MYAHGAQRRMVWRAVNGNEPLWWAAFRLGSDEIAVTCRRDYLREEDGRTVLMPPVRYPLDQVLCMYALASEDAFIVHGVGVSLAGRGVLLTGRSGAGKSTLARLLADDAQARARALSDDRVVVCRRNGRWTLSGTPWPGEQGAALNVRCPLDALLALRQADGNRLAPLTPQEALAGLLRTASIPWYEPALVPRLLDLCGDLCARARVGAFEFRPEPAAVALLEKTAAGFDLDPPIGQTAKQQSCSGCTGVPT
jgi:hypothetical protein